MKKIVHLIFSLEVGGAENLLVDIANEQAKTHNVAIIIVNSKFNAAIAGRINKDVAVYYIGRTEGNKNFYHIFKIWNYLFRINPDVIHCHNHKLIGLLGIWRKKAVITVHNVRIPVYNLKKYNKIFSISDAVKNDLLNRGKLNSAVIYNGIDFERFKRKQFSIKVDGEAYKIVQISRLDHHQKGQDLAIKALRRLNDLGHTQVQLYLIGEGPSRPFLEKLVEELGLCDKVFFLGQTERTWIYDNLQKFDLLIQPSYFEGFGLTVVEGLAAGLPVIASNVDGPAEILKDLPNAFLFESGNVDSFVEAISKVMNLDSIKLLQQLCDDSIAKVNNKYSITSTVNKYDLAYTSSL